MDFTKGLNEMQKNAVLHTDGPLLVLAGAGSGKTRVLTHRIAHMIENKKVAPWSILAITFTNKAAGEMKERVGALIGDDVAKDMWISTFHSMCVRILRRDSEKLGFGRYFTIYDTSDQKSLVKDILKQLNINEKNFQPSTILSTISAQKNDLVSPDEYFKLVKDDYKGKTIAKVYDAYQKKLKENNAMDFDDLLFNTYLLLKHHPDVLEFYQNKFKYILVDEYQDTNGVQYNLVQLLAKKHHNLCVVGDDDQSIYGWRGADVRNILDFERDFIDATVIKLEQNYRSTKNILDAANGVVAHNKGRKPKKLWTESDMGDKIAVLQLDTEYKEADAIAETIVKHIEGGERDYRDFAILYRTNAQSRVLEEKMVKNSIPYRLLGGVRFYERKEIKDIMGYLRVLANLKDDVALKRVINVPKRGIGATSVSNITEYANSQNMDFFEAAKLAKQFGILGNGPAQKVMGFVDLIEDLRQVSKSNDVKIIIDAILEKTEYTKYLRQTEGEEATERIANIEELVSKAANYMKEAEEPSLEAFLEEVALVADVDNYDADSNSVVMMTLHSAKGLEFPVVFMPGVEEGLFPSFMSMTEGDDKLEEERRLCYVGITRAREKLFILYAQQRTVFGRTQATLPSRFIKELPREVTTLANIQNGNRGNFVNPSRQFERFKANQTTGKAIFEPTAMQTEKPKAPVERNQYNPQNSIKNLSKIENLPKVTQEFTVGEKIKHKVFGEGKITAVEPLQDDVFVSIIFENGTEKKLSARFAKLKKC
ncbi:MAG: DNA helicase PcrA [Cellulosilyticaceae bacterium]